MTEPSARAIARPESVAIDWVPGAMCRASAATSARLFGPGISVATCAVCGMRAPFRSATEAAPGGGAVAREAAGAETERAETGRDEGVTGGSEGDALTWASPGSRPRRETGRRETRPGGGRPRHGRVKSDRSGGADPPASGAQT